MVQFAKGIILHKPGQAVKAIPRGNGMVEGYLLSFGNARDTDLEGQWFTKNTDLRLDYFPEYPVLYHHGMDSSTGLDPVGRIKSKNVDDIGLWVQAQLDLADQYGKEVYDLVQAKQFGWSSGAVDHLVQIDPSGEIKRWVLFEGSVTPTPAQPHKTTVRALKSLLDDHPIFALREFPSLAPQEKESEASEPEEPKVWNFGGASMKTSKRAAFVRKTLKDAGIENINDAQVMTIAAALDDEEAATMADDEFDPTMMAEDELDPTMMADDEFDPTMMAEDELDDAVMGDEDYLDPSTMEGDFDEDATLASEDGFYDETALSRRSRKGKKNQPRRKAFDLFTSLSDDPVLRYMQRMDQRQQRMEKRIKALAHSEAPGERNVGRGSTKAAQLRVIRDRADQPGAYKSAFMKWLRLGDRYMDSDDWNVMRKGERIEKPGEFSTKGLELLGFDRTKAYNITNAGSVGFGVPDDFVAELNKNIMVDADMARDCKQRTTTSDTILQPDLRTTDARRASAGRVAWVGESPSSGAEHEATEFTLGQIQLPIHVALTSYNATYSSLEDVAFDLQAEISSAFAEQIAIEYDDLLWTGSGQGRLAGIVTDTRVTGAVSAGVSTVGGYVASGAAAAIASGDPFKRMMLHLPPGYRKRAKWYMNSNTAAEISTLKDGEGRYLWGDAQGLNQGIPATFIGLPIVYNEYASDIAANAFPLIIADLGRGYLIGKRVDFSVRRFEDSATAKLDQVFFIGRARIGGQVIQPAAYKALKIAVS